MKSELREKVPGHWSVRRTTTGSMTLELFGEWTKYFVRRMEQEGYGKKHGHPLIVLIDGHASRWTYVGTYIFFHQSHIICIFCV